LPPAKRELATAGAASPALRATTPAMIRVQPGQHVTIVGQNGTGKSWMGERAFALAWPRGIIIDHKHESTCRGYQIARGLRQFDRRKISGVAGPTAAGVPGQEFGFFYYGPGMTDAVEMPPLRLAA